MRKLLTLLILTLALASFIASPVNAAGGQGAKTSDVCWMRPGTDIEVRAKFMTLPNGIVQQFRYEPEDMHGVFMPTSEFPNEPDEGDWRLWTARYYAPCEEGQEYEIIDFLEPGTEYWVQLETQD